MMKLEKLLERFISEKASDLHLAAGSPPMVRTLHGLKPWKVKAFTAQDIESVADDLISERLRKRYDETGACRFSYSFSGAIFRISVYKSRGAVSLAIRRIPGELPTLKEMEVPEPVKRLVQSQKGLFLVSGPAGSGKTSTLHAAIEFLSAESSRHIITIEDPIEYFHRHNASIVNQREVGVDVSSAVDGVFQALEQDPDVLAIGEICDWAMADAALQAAETGHLVLGTLNTGGTVHVINWLLDVSPPNLRDQVRQRLAGSLVGILSQVLLPPKEGGGSVPAYELMIMNSTIASLMRKNKIDRIINVIHSESQAGMMLMDDSLYDLYTAGRVTKEDMLSFAIESVEIETRLMNLKAREEEQRAFRE